MSTDPHVLPHVPTRADGRPERPLLVTAIAIVDLVGAGVVGLLGLLIFGAAVIALSRHEPDGLAAAATGAVLLGVAALFAAAGVGMLLMAPWGRAAQFAASIVGLLLFCVGTIVNALVIAYLLQPSVRLAFSGRRVDELTADERRLLVPAPRAANAGLVVVVVAVVLLVGVMFAGILAAIAVPNFLNAIQRAKQKRTMADIRAVAGAVEAYAVDFNAYPEAETIDELAAELEPTYLKLIPRKDGWARPFDVSLRADGYVVRSAGKDGAYEPADAWGYGETESFTERFDDDIVYSNGRYLRRPEAGAAP